MTDETNGDPAEAGDGELSRLFRGAFAAESPDFVRPSAEDIEAYVSGTATSSQRATVQAALARSAEFREEVLDLRHELEALRDPETLDHIAAVSVPAEFVRKVVEQSRYERHTGAEDASTRPMPPAAEPDRPAMGTPSTSAAKHQEGWNWVLGFFRRPGVAYALLLLVLIGAPLWLRSSGFWSRDLLLTAKDIPVEVSEVTRSGTNVAGQQIVLDSSLDLVELRIAQPGGLAARYRITLVTATGRRLLFIPSYRPPAAAGGESDWLVLALRARRLVPGDYLLRLEALAEDGSPLPGREVEEARLRVIRPR